jgi:excisionase family DNA binding protein
MAETTSLLPVRVAARLLGVSPKRVYQLLEEGRLEALRLGPRQTRVTRQSLEQFVQDGLAAERRRRGLIDAPPRVPGSFGLKGYR